jgi:S-adenosylmethionine:diacylglycerol 3-amino-3-carboxypropyl transferase
MKCSAADTRTKANAQAGTKRNRFVACVFRNRIYCLVDEDELVELESRQKSIAPAISACNSVASQITVDANVIARTAQFLKTMDRHVESRTSQR